MKFGLLCLTLALAAQPKAAAPPAPVSLSLHPAAAPVRALKYRLLADPTELGSANAAALYYRAGMMMGKEMPEDLIKKLEEWQTVPLAQLPRQEIRQLLDRYKGALQEVELGARRGRCDWGLPMSDGSDLIALLIPEVRCLRDLSKLLAVGARLAVAEGRLPQALHTLETGFGLARHLGEGPTLIHALVGNAIARTMAEQLQEFVQQPGAPNLYWALTALPRQFIDVTRCVSFETTFLYHMFPLLREVKGPPLGAPQAERLQKILEEVAAWHESHEDTTREAKEASKRAMLEATRKLSPQARQFLLDEGRKPAEVDALPVPQAVAIYSLYQYHRLTEDLLKWVTVPYWQSQAGEKQAEERRQAALKQLDGAPFVTATAAFDKIHHSMARTERALAALRCVEALRLYAAAHDGKLPAALADVTEVPVPRDPMTGEPFVYKLDGMRATLSAPPPAGETATVGNSIQYAISLKR
jgi:hypothetical protein